ncbi:MAG: hypothetical protein ABI301_00965, partial [Jatrophihabitantaceae bacterium]
MDDDEDVLEIGSRRAPRPVLTRVLLALVLVGAVGGYVLVHDRRGHVAHQAGPTRTVTSAPVVVPPPIQAPTIAPSPTVSLPPWPEVNGACGNNAFLPIVATRPLEQNTGVRVIVGDRLSTVDVDSGTVTRRAGIASGVYAADVATATDGTYATLVKCQAGQLFSATVVRLDPDGGIRAVARGPYAGMLSGGDHPWGVLYPADGSTVLDPLDGGRPLTMPSDFAPAAGYRNLVVGSAVLLSHSSSVGPQAVQIIDPRSGHVVRTLGESSSLAVSRGVVLWADYRCPNGQCAVHAYDLATGTGIATAATVDRGGGLWSAVL